jgi:cytochrome c peroxidase
MLPARVHTAVHCGRLALVLAAIAAGAQPLPPSRSVSPIGGAPADLAALIATPPLGLPAVPLPARNMPSQARIDLGRKLFYDRRLSFNRTLSCAMCHVPEQGFAQRELRTPVGLEGRSIKRNAPTLLNVAYRQALFHDGRETTLENQVWQPLLKFNEMANPSIGFVLQTLREANDYAGLFEAAYAQGLTAETVGMALASYQRGLLAADSPFDRWYFGGDTGALERPARRGWQLFRESGCIGCHTVGATAAQFTDDGFYDTGLGYARSMGRDTGLRRLRLAPGVAITPAVTLPRPVANDLGRYEATGRSADRWRFRVPTLRNIALTAPYMHDGSLPDLGAVVDHYNRGGVPHPGQDPRIRPLELDAGKRADLVSFLESLTASNIGLLLRDARSQAIGDAR